MALLRAILEALLKLIKKGLEALMRLPTLNPVNQTRLMTDVFRGYNHNLKISDGEMYDCTNLTSDYFPMLASRRPRVLYDSTYGSECVIINGGDIPVMIIDGTLYVNGVEQTWYTPVSTSWGQERQIIRFGSYALIWPDAVWADLKTFSSYGGQVAEHGSMGAKYELTQENPADIQFAPCDVDGNVYTNVQTGEEPVAPVNGTLWYDASDSSLKKWSTVQTMWVVIESVYTKVTFMDPERIGEIPALFSEGDAVNITGLDGGLDGTGKYLYGVGGGWTDPEDPEAEVEFDWIILIGWPEETEREDAYGVKLQREVPQADYIFECQNRLWGCHYFPYSSPQPTPSGGSVLSRSGTGTGGTTITDMSANEIFCTALGDFKNWRVYQGLSTDSWAASVGAPGAFTGGINYLGHPTFFKEDRCYVVTVSATGAHRIDETECRGVQKGSGKSLQIVGETLYYKSQTDVMAWQGGFPVSISTPALGDVQYRNAVAGAIGNKYYLSMQSGLWNAVKNDLFVYDTARGLWLREDDTRVTCFATINGELYAAGEYPIDSTESDGETGIPLITTEKRLMKLAGNVETGWTAETDVPWNMETGLLYYEYPDRKYVSRYNIRLQMAQNATAAIYIEYDSSGDWGQAMTFSISGTGTATIPIRPRRCDHLRMKISGTGELKILSIARILEVGSDV